MRWLHSVPILSVLSTAVLARPTNNGIATYYQGVGVEGTCSFEDYSLPPGVYGTALSSVNWDNAGNCGGCIEVGRGGNRTIKAMIVNQCPECKPNQLDLYPNAFAALANPSKGIIDVGWNFVPCHNNGALWVKTKDGASPNWFSMQVVNSNLRIASLQVSTDGGASWKPTERQSYNYFQMAGTGTETADILITAVNGDSIKVWNVPVSEGTTKKAMRNF